MGLYLTYYHRRISIASQPFRPSTRRCGGLWALVLVSVGREPTRSSSARSSARVVRRQVSTLAAIVGVRPATDPPACDRDCSQNSRFRHRSLLLKPAGNLAREAPTVRNLGGLRTVRTGSGRKGYDRRYSRTRRSLFGRLGGGKGRPSLMTGRKCTFPFTVAGMSVFLQANPPATRQLRRRSVPQPSRNGTVFERDRGRL